VAVVIVVALLRSALFFEASLRAATRVHDRMVASVLRAPLAFFHTNPSGRVLNRFSSDQVWARLLQQPPLSNSQLGSCGAPTPARPCSCSIASPHHMHTQAMDALCP
jgi:hypothetical protein